MKAHLETHTFRVSKGDCNFVMEKALFNKAHIICQHIPEYVEKKKMALDRTSDQLIEATHAQTNKLFSRSKYFVKALNSPAHKSKIEKVLKH